MTNNSDRRGILSLVKSIAQGTEIQSEDTVDVNGRLMKSNEADTVLGLTTAGDFHMVVPSSEEKSMARICRALDSAMKQSRFGIKTYGFNSTTLDEVFVKLGEMGSLRGRSSSHHKQTDTQPHQSQEESQEESQEDAPIRFSPPSTSATILLLLKRRFMCETRNIWAFYTSVLIPVFFAAVCCVFLTVDFSGLFATKPAQLVSIDAVSALPPSPYNDRFVLPIVRNSSDFPLAQELVNAISSFGTANPSLPLDVDATQTWEASGDFACFEAFLIDDDSGTCARAEYASDSAAAKPSDPAAETGGNDPASGTKIGAIAVTNATLQDGTEIPVFNLIVNNSNAFAGLGLLAYFYDGMIDDAAPAIHATAKAFPQKAKTEDEKEQEDATTQMLKYSLAPMFLVYGTLAVASQIVYDLVDEKKTGLKHLHLLMGVSPLQYWLGNFVWDVTKVSVSTALIIVAFAISSISVSDAGLLATPEFAGIILVYFLTLITWSYFLSFIFTGK